ncbi:MAG: helix-turn-helix domain-containing protein [Filifactoraceae bacterium]
MNLKKICIEKNISFKELSERSGISLTYIYELERGAKKNPSLFTLMSLAETLGVSVQDLVFSRKELDHE